MSASKQRPVWQQLPTTARELIERLAGAPVVRATSCPGGFSPGFASRLVLADGRRVFAKAMDAASWPFEGRLARAEARVTATLPATLPVPRLLGHAERAGWTVLLLEDVPGVEPARPWCREHFVRVLDALPRVPAPAGLPDDHPRLGGFAALAADPQPLAERVPWVARQLPRLVELEAEGLLEARGEALVHFDCYPHNVLLSDDRVVFVDWPHARRGNPVVDTLTLAISAFEDGLDPEPMLAGRLRAGGSGAVDAVLAAHAGFLLSGGLAVMPPGLEPIGEAKLRLGLAAAGWLRRRLSSGRS